MTEKTYTKKQALTPDEINDITDSAIKRVETYRSKYQQYVVEYNKENRNIAESLFDKKLLGYAILRDIEGKPRFIQLYALNEIDVTKLIGGAVASELKLQDIINPLLKRDKWGQRIKPALIANIQGVDIYSVDDYSILHILRLLRANRKAWTLNGKVYKVLEEYNITNPYRVSDYLPKGN